MRGFGYDIEYGIRRAMFEIISGFISSLLLEYLFWAFEEVFSNLAAIGVPTGLIRGIKDIIVLLFMLMPLVDVLRAIETMKYWRTEYLVGFLIGFILFEAAVGSLLDVFNLMLIMFGLMVIIIRGLQEFQL